MGWERIKVISLTVGSVEVATLSAEYKSYTVTGGISVMSTLIDVRYSLMIKV